MTPPPPPPPRRRAAAHMQVRLLTCGKYAALAGIVACSGMWVLWWPLSTEPASAHSPDNRYLDRLDKHIKSRFFRTDAYYGSVLIYQTAPFIVVALLSFIMIELRRKLNSTVPNIEERGLSKATTKRFLRLSSYPLVIKSPMGVLTSADALFIFGMLFLVTYTFGRECYLSFKELEADYKKNPTDHDESLAITKVNYAAYYMGRSAMIPFSLLWIPVSRGSPFLRLINMPFEHAVKYHIWMSILCLFMLVTHGILYIVYYVNTNSSKEIVSWDKEGESCSVVAGLIATFLGLIMWLTSLSFFRRRWYELFFGIHHLYILFFIFWLYHVIWTIHFFIIPCLLFVVDRFLRMVQSQQSVDVLSAKLLESGSIEIKIAKSNTEGLMYYALSSWYLRFPSLSNLTKLQWHLFCVTSTEMDEKEELSIIIKPLGKWTTLLKEKLIKYIKMCDSIKSNHCPFTFKARVEGPYGDESNFFLEYKVIVLVGGGIGVTPLLALLRDIFHRYRCGGKNLPSTIYLYHCVRKPKELCVLNSLDPNHILPKYQDIGLDIRAFVYVTSSSPNDYNESIRRYLDTKEVLDLATFEGISHNQSNQISKDIFFSISGPNPQSISSISTRGSSMWVGTILFGSIWAFYVLWGLSNVFLVKDYEASLTNYSRTHVVVGSMVLGIVLFGGIPTTIWWLKLKLHRKSKAYARSSSELGILNGSQSISQGEELNHVPKNIETTSFQHGSPWNGTIQLSCRPHWKEIFNTLNKEYKGKDIGVFVSGGLSMQEDIASQCRLHTKLFGRDSSSNNFHYHPISFDL